MVDQELWDSIKDSPEWLERLSTVFKISDEAVLSLIVLTDSDWSVRAKAVSQIPKESYSRISYLLKLVTEPRVLQELVKKVDNYSIAFSLLVPALIEVNDSKLALIIWQRIKECQEKDQ